MRDDGRNDISGQAVAASFFFFFSQHLWLLDVILFCFFVWFVVFYLYLFVAVQFDFLTKIVIFGSSILYAEVFVQGHFVD
jgi:hypothetical protein